MRLAASTALRSRGHIFTLRFIRPLRKRACNSVRIIAITRINLHFELPSCKPRLTRATCYYSQMKVRRVYRGYPINIGSLTALAGTRWDLHGVDELRIPISKISNIFSGRVARLPRIKILEDATRAALMRMIYRSMSSTYLPRARSHV